MNGLIVIGAIALVILAPFVIATVIIVAAFTGKLSKGRRRGVGYTAGGSSIGYVGDSSSSTSCSSSSCSSSSCSSGSSSCGGGGCGGGGGS